MSGALSKRQQARNERALQDLIKSVPGNNVCADCQARNPGWASWSLGIFLCMRCAALHRKMGTHITKVKSLSMDSWSNDQVDYMKRVGNVVSNCIYNPRNEKPPIPFDADEADSAMERFIRAKYQERVSAARHDTGSSNSDDHPPPLPPKTGSRFGFRSASSIFPLSSKSRREPPPPVDIPRRRSPSPLRNKETNMFGGAVGAGPLDLAGKMARLRDMGFMDDKRNLAVLNGLGGNLEKTIDTLVRLGEGNGNLATDSSSSRGSRTPNTPKFPLGPGLAVNRPRDKPTPSPKSTNPFDMLDAPPIAQPQSSQSTGSKPHPLSQPAANNPFLQAPPSNSNPFGLTPSQSQYSLNQAFQNMAVTTSHTTQPLFPNHTGGFPAPQQSQYQQLYQQSMTPPVPSLPQQYYPSAVYDNQPRQQQQVPQQQNTSYNPFMQQNQQFPPINTNFQNNPYAQQQHVPQNLYQSPVQQSPQQQLPSSVYENGVQQQTQTQPPPQLNPFLAQNNNQQQNQSQVPQQPYNQAQQQPQFQQQPQSQQQIRQQSFPVIPQQIVKADKRSILDLYNYPQLAPSRPQQENQPIQEQQQNYLAAPAAPQQQQISVTSPLVAGGSRNPFNSGAGDGVQSSGGDALGNMGQFPPVQNGSRHVSQESMSIDAGGWQNGRHSPDAWGTISARSMK